MTKTFSQEEHDAILVATVERETAALRAAADAATAERDQMRAERDEQAGKVDLLEAEKASVVAEKAQVEQDFKSFKDDLEALGQIEAVKDERVAKVKEVAAHLDDAFYTDARVARWAGMEQAAFDDYVAELAAVAPKTEGSPAGGPPKETAMEGTRKQSASQPAKSNTARLLSFRQTV